MMCDKGLQVQAYHDGQLDPDSRAQIEAHLSTCAACAAELEKLRNLSNVFHAYAPEPPAGMMQRIYNRLEDAASTVIFRLVTRLTAAAAAILLAGSVWLVAESPSAAQPAAFATDQSALPVPWEHAAVALNADPSPDVQFASLVFADSGSDSLSSGQGQ